VDSRVRSEPNACFQARHARILARVVCTESSHGSLDKPFYARTTGSCCWNASISEDQCHISDALSSRRQQREDAMNLYRDTIEQFGVCTVVGIALVDPTRGDCSFLETLEHRLFLYIKKTHSFRRRATRASRALRHEQVETCHVASFDILTLEA
jgi:hypothetical protein